MRQPSRMYCRALSVLYMLQLTLRSAVQGHAAPTREDLEHADAGMAKPGKEAGPSGRPGDPYTQVRSQCAAEACIVALAPANGASMHVQRLGCPSRSVPWGAPASGQRPYAALQAWQF